LHSESIDGIGHYSALWWNPVGDQTVAAWSGNCIEECHDYSKNEKVLKVETEAAKIGAHAPAEAGAKDDILSIQQIGG
jgi:hypothetical protein